MRQVCRLSSLPWPGFYILVTITHIQTPLVILVHGNEIQLWLLCDILLVVDDQLSDRVEGNLQILLRSHRWHFIGVDTHVSLLPKVRLDA